MTTIPTLPMTSDPIPGVDQTRSSADIDSAGWYDPSGPVPSPHARPVHAIGEGPRVPYPSSPGALQGLQESHRHRTSQALGLGLRA